MIQQTFNDCPALSFSLSPRGQRIPILKRKDDRPRNTIHVVHGWMAELAKSQAVPSSTEQEPEP